MKVYLLQAAIGFSIMLYETAKTLLFFGVPIVTDIWTLITINQKTATTLPERKVLKIIGRSFLYSTTSVTGLTVAIILFNFSQLISRTVRKTGYNYCICDSSGRVKICAGYFCQCNILIQFMSPDSLQK